MNYSIITIVFAVSLITSNAFSFKLGIDHEIASQAREDQHIAQAVDAANTASAEAISKIVPKYTTIKQTLQKEIYEKPVYRDCRNSADGVQSINAALTGIVPADKSKLPKIDAVK